jgi:putative hemolysin
MEDGNPLYIGLLVGCILLEAVATSAKTAFEEDGSDDRERYLNTLSVLLTLLNLGIGALAVSLFDLILWQRIVGGIALIFVVALFGIVLPEKLSKRKAEWLRGEYQRLLGVLSYLIRPFTLLLEVVTKAILWLLRIKPEDLEENVTEEEIISIVNEGSRQGVLEDNEVEMISNIIELDEKEVRDVMTHRRRVVSVGTEMTVEEALQLMLKESYSRYPLYEEEKDNIVGVLHLRDVTATYVSGEYKEKTLKEIARTPYFVPDTQSADTLFDEMQKKKIHMAIAVDEYGQMAGIVAMEDILEEIVGNIFDEYDIDERMILRQGANRYIMKGMTPMEEVEEALGIELEQDDFDTLNGWMISMLGHLPKDKEKAVISAGGCRFQIIDAKNNMIRNVKVVKEAMPDADTGG